MNLLFKAESPRPRSGLPPLAWAAPILAGLVPLLLVPAARAHHLVDITGLAPTALNGLLGGLAHPVLGPDHLLFLLSLSLVGLRHRLAWVLGLLSFGLLGSCLGLWLPGLPAAEALVAFSLVVVAMVLLARWPRILLLPAIAMHGYVLSEAVLGWTHLPLASYLIGLMLAQSLLLLLAVTLLRRITAAMTPAAIRLAGAALLGCGAAWTWSALVG